jgi:hypothetical protein
MKGALGVDLTGFDEHLGAVHLCFANHILRALQTSVAKDERTLLVRCYERTGRSVDGCELELCDEWPHLGPGFRRRVVLTKPFLAIPLPSAPNNLRARLFDRAGRCIENDSLAFIKKFAMALDLVGTRRVVLKSKDGSEETRDVQTVSREKAIPAPTEHEEPVAILAAAQRQREMDDLEAQRVFIYFPGGDESRRRAYEVVRELIGRVRERCYILDPYLAAADVAAFVPFVPASGCSVRLLSSQQHLSGSVDDSTTHETALLNLLGTLNQLPFAVEVRKLLGKRSPVHDRILIIDDEAYLLGSSLNEFGARATTLFRVPNPASLRSNFEAWWTDAAALRP